MSKEIPYLASVKKLTTEYSPTMLIHRLMVGEYGVGTIQCRLENRASGRLHDLSMDSLTDSTKLCHE